MHTGTRDGAHRGPQARKYYCMSRRERERLHEKDQQIKLYGKSKFDTWNNRLSLWVSFASLKCAFKSFGCQYTGIVMRFGNNRLGVVPHRTHYDRACTYYYYAVAFCMAAKSIAKYFCECVTKGWLLAQSDIWLECRVFGSFSHVRGAT